MRYFFLRALPWLVALLVLGSLLWLVISYDGISLARWKKSKGIPSACPNTSIFFDEHLDWCLKDIEIYRGLVKGGEEKISMYHSERHERKIFQESICSDGLSNDSKTYIYCINSRNYESSCAMAYRNALDKFKACVRGFDDRATVSFGDYIAADSVLRVGLAGFLSKRK